MLKKIIIGFLLTLILIIAAAFYIIPSLINKEAFKSGLHDSFKAATGLDLDIEGEMLVERFPVPHIRINSLYVHNVPGASSPYLLSIRLLEIWPSYKSLFSKQVSIQKINIDGADIELERLGSGQMNWSEVAPRLPVTSDTSVKIPYADPALTGTSINLVNGAVHYTDTMANITNEYKDIHFTFLNGGTQSDSTIKLGMQFRDKALNVTGRINNIAHALSAGEVPAELNITSDHAALDYKGNVGYKGDKIAINGNIKIKIDDIITWMCTLSGNMEKPATAEHSYKPVPFQLTSDITSDEGKIVFPNLLVDGALMKGNGQIEISSSYAVTAKAVVNSVNLDTFFDSRLFAPKDITALKNTAAIVKDVNGIDTRKSFFDALNLSADLTVEDALYNQQHLKNAHITFDMSHGEMTISQATATLPGDTRFVFAGLGKESFEGFALEGEIDAVGDDFTAMTKLFKTNAVALPAQDFKRFRFKANAALSTKNLRLSEIAARIENIGILGGIIATFGDRTRLDAALRIGGVNLDHFALLWGIDDWQHSFFDTASGEKSDNFLCNWLRRLDYDAVVNVSLEQAILMGLPRDTATFRLQATSGKVALNNIKTTFNGSDLSGDFSLDVTGNLPKITLTAKTDLFNPDTFFTPDGKAKPALTAASPGPSPDPSSGAEQKPRWSHQTFDFHWLELLNATFHFTIGNYQQGQVTAQSLDIQGTIQNGTLTADSLTGIVLGAQIGGKLSLVDGRIPSIAIAANINELDPVRLLPFLPVLNSMTGKYNLNVKLDTSGIDMYAWVSNLEGFVGVGGTNVDINGFNLAGIIHSVSYVRTVADILNVVRRAFPGGDTLFKHIEGQWTIAGGILNTSNSHLTNESADGVLTSKIDLINWQMQSSISLSLKALDPKHPPGMTISFSGSFDKPETSIDTRSLEQYVTDKTSQQMLKEYGTP